METTYVCGHINPDTDSIVSAMAYANLCNAMGDTGYVPARLGHLNDESNFLLKKFGFESPIRLYNVRTQVRDIEYDELPQLSPSAPVSHAWSLMQSHEGNKIAQIINEDGSLYGVIVAGDIAERDMSSVTEPRVENVPVFNLLAAIEGTILNNADDVFDEISGEVCIVLPSEGGLGTHIKKDSIIICGDQPDVVDHALENGASCVILSQSTLAEKYRNISSATCLIATPFDAYRAARLIYQSIPVGRIVNTKDPVCFHLDDYLDDVRETIGQSRYRSYPVLDENDRVVGALSRYHLMNPRQKRVFLVDHNELGQSVPGLDQATLVGIIDHHRLADVQTGYPVFMRNEPVGSTTTIVATMYQESGLMPGPALAGLMAAAIISDTVMFKSPTSTPRDKRIAERLARIAGIDLEKLGKEVFQAASGADKSAEALVMTDFKEFNIADHHLGIGQITTMDSDTILKRIGELKEVMEKIRKEKEYEFVILMITDALKEGSELIITGDEDVLSQAFAVTHIHDGHAFFKGIMSRKKQVVPALSALWG